VCINLNAQETDPTIPDSLVVKNKYGLRVGVDASKLARTFLETDYSAIELNADYRLTYRLYAAGEFGNEEHTTSTRIHHFNHPHSLIFFGRWIA
jgi:hypothetical protein